MSVNVSPTKRLGSPQEFKGSLVRTAILWLLLLSLIPLLTVGAATYLRSRALLRGQVTSQLEVISNTFSEQLSALAENRNATMDEVMKSTYLVEALDKLIASLSTTDTKEQQVRYDSAQFLLQTSLLRTTQTTLSAPLLDQIAVIGNDGKLIISTNQLWAKYQVQEDTELFSLLGTNQTRAVFNGAPFYGSDLVLFTSRTLKDKNGKVLATVIGTTQSPDLINILKSAGQFFPNANAYYYLPNGTALDANQAFTSLSRQAVFENQSVALGNILFRDDRKGIGDYRSFNQTTVVSYAQWIPTANIGLVIEIPQTDIYGQIPILGTFNVLLLLGALSLTATLLYIGTSRLIARPMNQLAEKARQFTLGDWSQRAEVIRNDEIGLLGHSFNTMVTQLSDLYRSLEQKVEERTEQIRTASEIAQLATLSTDRREILQQTVNLVVERFGFTYACVYLMDESNGFVNLHEASQSGAEIMANQIGARVRIGSTSLVGWVAANNQARVANEVTEEDFYQKDPLYPGTRSEVGVPITIGNQVLGVLNVQSLQNDAFDPETTTVFQTLANQIAIGLQNTRLLDAAKIDLEETDLLYRTSRQVTHAQTEEAIIQTLNASFGLTQYVSAIFAVQEDHLSILALSDPKNPNSMNSIQGITLPLQKVSLHLSENRVVIVENLAEPSDLDNILSFFNRRGCRSAALFAINEKNHLAKVVVLGSRAQLPITPTAMQPFVNLAEVTENTLERISVLQSLNHRLNELQALANVSQAISSETQLNDLYRALHQQIANTIGAETSFLIAHYDAANQRISIPYLYENNEEGERLDVEPFALGEGLISKLIINCQPLMLVKDTEQKALAMGAKIKGQPAKSWMGVPLIAGGEVIGAMVAQDLFNEERFSESDLSLFLTLAPQIAVIIRNVQLLNEAQRALITYEKERAVFNAHLENTPDNIFFKDTNGHYLRVSRSLAKRTGFGSPSELIGKSDFDLYSSDTASQNFLAEQEVMRSKRAILGSQVKIIQSDESEVWMLTTRIPVLGHEQEPIGVMVIQRDITAIKHTEELANRRAEQLMTAAEIARDTAGTLELPAFLQNAVNLVRDRFGFYHASIFLLDKASEYAILRESTGEAGEKLKQAQHKLAVGSRSLVGQATQQGQPVVVNDVREDPSYYPNPLLPDTRAELVIPLKTGDRVRGALDVQSIHPDAFSDEDITILQILADQLTAAVNNAELFAETEEHLMQHRALHQITSVASTASNVDDALGRTVEGLSKILPDHRIAIFLVTEKGKLRIQAEKGYTNFDINREFEFGEGIVGTVAVEKRAIRVNDTRTDSRYITGDSAVLSELAVPLLYSGELLGVLSIESTELAAYDANDQEIQTTLGNNLGAVLANVRLVTQVQQQVERQRQLYDITSRIRRSVDIDTILETSTAEIAKVLRARRAEINITMGKNEPAPQEPEKTAPHRSNGNGHSNGNGAKA